MAVIPFGSEVTLFGHTVKLVIADIGIGPLFIFAIASLGVYGITLAGWSSNSKYPFFGGVRSCAQMISYEAAMGLAIVAVVLWSSTVGDTGGGTLSLAGIVERQVGDAVQRDRGLARAGLAGHQADGAQLQQVLQTRLGLGKGSGGEQLLGLRGEIEGKGGQGEVLTVHQFGSPSSWTSRGSARSFRPDGAGSGAGPSTSRVRDGRLRLTKQLA